MWFIYLLSNIFRPLDKKCYLCNDTWVIAFIINIIYNTYDGFF